jgi:uncharacterized repeat protein (TIGR01451 family)
MRKRRWLTGSSLAALSLLAAGTAQAAPALRVQVEQKGDFLLIGNTLGYECAAGTPLPVVGTVGACGNNLGDTAPDIFWRADAPMNGQAQASTAVTVAQARSTAVLSIPNGATVTHAFLYWGGIANAADNTVTLDRQGGFMQSVTAAASLTSTNNTYQSRADITDIVQAQGSGAYRVSGINTADVVNVNNSVSFAGWWMAVFYNNPAEPLRNLALFDGLDSVGSGSPQSSVLSGFLVPPAFGMGKLGVVAWEGDNQILGDSFSFNGSMLSNAQNPVDNFFNGSRTSLGNLVSVAGDLPQLSGAPQSMGGIDIDIVDVTALLTVGQTSAPIAATSMGDQYYLAGFVTSIPTFKPDFTSSQKSAVDLNGGGLLAGDILEYTVVVTNTGSDTSVNTVLTDALPSQVTYVPGTLQITAGANAGVKTDAGGDDQCDFAAATSTVTCRLGTGASAAAGGQMAVGESTTIKLQVTVNAGASGTISNQAIINAGGLQGSPPNDTPTDGNGSGAPGSPPTDVVIDLCQTDADCATPTPKCNVAPSPNVCVQCLASADCPNLTPVCDATNACVCIPSGAEVCDGVDNDCNGMADEGCVDTDGDGLFDSVEDAIGSNPNDQDSDDDGLIDSLEPQPDVDSDGDGLINVLDPDSDNDGLLDGTELGKNCSNPDTNVAAGHCRADADMGATITDPLDDDSDNGGVSDGSEDTNLNGQLDAGELDPTAGHGADDVVNDSDGDGLSDGLEGFLGSDPNDADSDDDGVIDGDEANPSDDTDGDGLINVLDPDSDDDALWDGTESGVILPNADTDVAAGYFIPDADPRTETSPLLADSDGGGIIDGSEDLNHNGALDAGEIDPTQDHGADDATVTDSDGDGLSDVYEGLIGTDPNDADSDDDGVIDGEEPNPIVDSDGDGKINALDPDSDDDGLFDGTEMGITGPDVDTDVSKGFFIADADPNTRTSPLDPDTDNGGVKDGIEDANHNGKVDSGERDPTLGHGADDLTGDSDGDGLTDLQEMTAGTNPNDADSDDDGVIDGQEPLFDQDSDGDGLINALDPDSDNDGLFDGTELGITTPNAATNLAFGTFVPDADPTTTTDPLDPDPDDGGVSDGAEDTNLNGKLDPGELDPTAGHGADDATLIDSDGDGLSDATETFIGTNPNDADSDDDGVIDGAEANPTADTDGDGLINALDPDSDNDGLFDGTEAGITTPDADTDVAKGFFVPDADPTTTTSPVDPDSDDGGVSDGNEDTNHNGKVDAGERDPTAGHGGDDLTGDSDGDGLSDAEEGAIGTDPNDADSDDDGALDGAEPSPGIDSDGDGLINALDPDSDNDGLPDGTELGLDCSNPATDKSKNHCTPDSDQGGTTTNPLDKDTDDGGVSDGSEDSNHNGAIDAGETDPTLGHGADDNQNVDTDGDGLTDNFEDSIGTNPNDADSDDDGVIDGNEPNPADDTDGDGKINALDPDSDNDGLLDGTELGLDCSNTATDAAAGNCIADADPTTTTSPLLPDTDGGGVKDGDEDKNHDGKLDPGETDPTLGHGADDKVPTEGCTDDSECGNATSGKVCDLETSTCIAGCHSPGNGCPDGQVCDSLTQEFGVCQPDDGNDDGVVAEGSGLFCAARPTSSGSSPVGWLVPLALGGLLVARRRRRR